MDAENEKVNHRLVGKYIRGEEKSDKKKKGNELPRVNLCSNKLSRHSGCQ